MVVLCSIVYPWRRKLKSKKSKEENFYSLESSPCSSIRSLSPTSISASLDESSQESFNLEESSQEDVSSIDPFDNYDGARPASLSKKPSILTEKELELYRRLETYKLSADQQRQLGYPQESNLYPGKTYIFRDPEFCKIFSSKTQSTQQTETTISKNKLNVNAKVFIPGQRSPPDIKEVGSRDYSWFLDRSDSDASGDFNDKPGDSDNSDKRMFTSSRRNSISADDDDLDFIDNGFIENNNKVFTIERSCARCKQLFYVDRDGQYLSLDPCSYHWGKLGSKQKSEPVFICCGAKTSARQGCTKARCHVWSGLPDYGGILGPLDGFVKTPARSSECGVYGLDCEMCYTTAGLEITKITVVDVEGELVYETLVMPENEIVDYNTRFSGISEKHLLSGNAKDLKEVQNDLLEFINADTILIGHGLENDLRALGILHGAVVDTAVVFPHYYGLPFKRSLRSLVSIYLKQNIQGSSLGHDSFEDAKACIELMLWKTRKDNLTKRFA